MRVLREFFVFRKFERQGFWILYSLGVSLLVVNYFIGTRNAKCSNIKKCAKQFRFSYGMLEFQLMYFLPLPLIDIGTRL